MSDETPPVAPVQNVVLTLANEEAVNAMLAEIDEIARDSCNYEYGLPMYDEGSKARMREAVYRLMGRLPLAAKYFHSVACDGKQITCGVQTMEELNQILSR